MTILFLKKKSLFLKKSFFPQQKSFFLKNKSFFLRKKAFFRKRKVSFWIRKVSSWKEKFLLGKRSFFLKKKNYFVQFCTVKSVLRYRFWYRKSHFYSTQNSRVREKIFPHSPTNFFLIRRVRENFLCNSVSKNATFQYWKQCWKGQFFSTKMKECGKKWKTHAVRKKFFPHSAIFFKTVRKIFFPHSVRFLLFSALFHTFQTSAEIFFV